MTSSSAAPLTIHEINQLPFEEFITRYKGIVEHGDLVAAAVWSRRPFTSVKELQQGFDEFVDALPVSGKEGVLRLHPDLAGRIAASGQLTASSNEEQKAAGLDTLTKDEQTTLNILNDKYKSKFNFPFVICAKENKKVAIINGLKTRLENVLETEVRNGISEVKKIGAIRLGLIVRED